MKGIIQEAFGGNRYSVRLVFDQRSAELLIEGLIRRAADLEETKAQYQQRAESARADVAAAEAERAAAAEDYQACTADLDPGDVVSALRCQQEHEPKIRAAQARADNLAVSVTRWEAEVRRITLQQIALDKRRGEIERLGELQDFATIEAAHCQPED